MLIYNLVTKPPLILIMFLFQNICFLFVDMTGCLLRAAESVFHCIANNQIACSSSYIISFNHFFCPHSHLGLFDTFDKTFTTPHWLLIK